MSRHEVFSMSDGISRDLLFLLKDDFGLFTTIFTLYFARMNGSSFDVMATISLGCVVFVRVAF